MRVDVYIHPIGEDKLDLILQKLNSIIAKENEMAGELDALTAEVANATTVEQSAITLIQGLAAQLAAAGTDPAKLQALHDQLMASDAALAAAIQANTPAAPVAPPTTP